METKNTTFEMQKLVGDQGCQIFVGTTYQNGKILAKLPQNLPNGHSMHQMALKYQITIKYTKIFRTMVFKNIPKL
jgi:hypothetical protein